MCSPPWSRPGRATTFRDGRREDYITKQCAVFFDAEAQCPEWIKLQKKIAGGNAELIAYKQRLFGLLLTGEMVEILFILHGGGQNGKSTEFETISRLLGDYAHAADAQVLLSPRDRGGATPEIVSVKGKRAVFINETGESDHLNESRVKYLCGNDTMSGRNLYEGIINFRPTHKTLLLADPQDAAADKPQAEDLPASRTFSSDRGCREPHFHSRRTKGSVCSG